MRKSSLKYFGILAITLYSAQILANDRIKINVEIKNDSVAAIGYTVEGKSFGGMGRSYLGVGPKNKKYVFGVRKHSVLGADIRCGEITLRKNSTVVLEIKGDKCISRTI